MNFKKGLHLFASNRSSIVFIISALSFYVLDAFLVEQGFLSSGKFLEVAEELTSWPCHASGHFLFV